MSEGTTPKGVDTVALRGGEIWYFEASKKRKPHADMGVRNSKDLKVEQAARDAQAHTLRSCDSQHEWFGYAAGSSTMTAGSDPNWYEMKEEQRNNDGLSEDAELKTKTDPSDRGPVTATRGSPPCWTPTCAR